MIKAAIFRQHFGAALFGLVVGLIILISFNLPERWTIATLAGLLCFLLGMLFINYYEEIIYACFIFFLPIQLGKSFFYVPFAGGGHELRFNLPEIFFAILLIFWFVGLVKMRRGTQLDRGLLRSFGIFLFVSFLSLTRAIDVTLGVFELIRVLISFLIFLFIANYIDNERKLKQTIVLLLLGAIPQISIGLYQWLFQKDVGLYLYGEMGLTPQMWVEEPLVRVGGLIGVSNAFATYLVLTLPFCMIFWSRHQRLLIKMTSFVVFIAGIFALIATQSRGGWLGFGIAFIVASLIFILAAKRLRIRRWLITLVVIISFSIVGFLSYDVIQKRILLDDRGSAAARIPMMTDALNMIQDKPLLGVGINNYALAVPSYDVTGIHKEWQATTVHNFFLLIAAESGLIAMFAFVWFWVLIMWRVRKLFNTPNVNHFLLAIAFTMSLVAFFVIHQVDANYRFYPAIQRQLWLIAGLIVATTHLDQNGQN